MAGVKITALTDLATPADADVLVIVDDDDGAGGTTKKITFANLAGAVDSVDFATQSSLATIADNAGLQSFVGGTYYLIGTDQFSGNGGFFVDGGYSSPKYDADTQILFSTAFEGDGSRLTNVPVDSAYIERIADSADFWELKIDGSKEVVALKYDLVGRDLYLRGVNPDGTQQYIIGGPDDEIDLVASGGNQHQGLSNSQPWNAMIGYGADGQQYTTSVLGVDEVGIHSRYGYTNHDITRAVMDHENEVAHRVDGFDRMVVSASGVVMNHPAGANDNTLTLQDSAGFVRMAFEDGTSTTDIVQTTTGGANQWYMLDPDLVKFPFIANTRLNGSEVKLITTTQTDQAAKFRISDDSCEISPSVEIKLNLSAIPTSDPAVAGVLWRSGTALQISLG